MCKIKVISIFRIGGSGLVEYINMSICSGLLIILDKDSIDVSLSWGQTLANWLIIALTY
jgi:hypothetical protein